MKKYFYSLLILMFSLHVFGQSDFMEGYIITLKNEKIQGYIDDRGDIRMSQNCIFKNSFGKIKTYNPNEIEGYRFNNGKYYISKTIDNHKVFMEYLINGKLKVYYYRDEKLGDRYFVDKDDLGIKELPQEDQTIKTETKTYENQPKQLIGTLNYYMGDAPKMFAENARIQSPNHSDLIKLAKDYHNMVCKDYDCEIYQKTKVNLNYFGLGFEHQKIDNDKQDIHGNFNFINFSVRLQQSSINKNLYLRTGIGASISNPSIIKIPLGVEYVYPRGFFRPILGLSLNMYRVKTDKTTWFPSEGFNIGGMFSLSKKIALNVNYEQLYTSHDDKVFPSLLFSNAVKVQLEYLFVNKK